MKKFLVAFTPIVVFLTFYLSNLGVSFNFEDFCNGFFLRLPKNDMTFGVGCGLFAFSVSVGLMVFWALCTIAAGPPKWVDNLIKKITG